MAKRVPKPRKLVKKVSRLVKKSAKKNDKKIPHRPKVLHKTVKQKKTETHIKTGVSGLDDLIEKGIPTGSSVIVAGGSGSGKTIMCLQILANAAKSGKKALYMSFEESEDRLRDHMRDFGWDPAPLEKSGKFMIKRFSVYDVTRFLEALMAKSEGELMIDVDPIILPKGFKPDVMVIDSVTAIASAFQGKETYRSYIENLFRYLEGLKVKTFLITETEQVPTVFSPTGVEEFLADGVIVIYNLRKGDIRQGAIEVLKMRGTGHIKKVVAMRVVSGGGIEVYPEQEVFGDIQ